MKKSAFYIVLLSLISVFVLSQYSYASWIWTPETKKFINPKNAVKDTPKEQFEWAMTFYNAKDYQRALFEFEKLAKQYEFSDYASRAQYYVGLCYEDMQKYYSAFENYQKAIDNFPHLSNTEEVLAREYAIGIIYLEKSSPKVMGNDIMAPLDRAVEILKKVVENAPYGKYAQEAQFKLGEALKKSERYEEAIQAYHKLVEDYPNSKFATRAMYEESSCAYKASLRPAYDATATDNAIKTFEKFTYKNKDTDLAQKADKTMKRLKDNVAEKSFKTAEFYESQGKKEAAIIYYQDVIDTYPDSSFVGKAKAKIEALKNPKKKEILPPLDFIKKKPKPVTPQAPKKPWKALSFESKKIQARKEPEKSATEAPKKKSWNLFGLGTKKNEASKETPEKKAWTPLKFDSKKKEVKPVPEKPAAEVPVAEPKKKEWKPLNFDNKKKDKEEPVDKETPKKKGWNLFGLGAKKNEVPKETPKKKEWVPLKFDSKKKEVKPVPEKPVVETPAVVPVAAPKKKGWKPLYFGTNDAPMGGLR